MTHKIMRLSTLGGVIRVCSRSCPNAWPCEKHGYRERNIAHPVWEPPKCLNCGYAECAKDCAQEAKFEPAERACTNSVNDTNGYGIPTSSAGIGIGTNGGSNADIKPEPAGTPTWQWLPHKSVAYYTSTAPAANGVTNVRYSPVVWYVNDSEWRFATAGWMHSGCARSHEQAQNLARMPDGWLHGVTASEYKHRTGPWKVVQATEWKIYQSGLFYGQADSFDALLKILDVL
jgi:hypothetical protein